MKTLHKYYICCLFTSAMTVLANEAQAIPFENTVSFSGEVCSYPNAPCSPNHGTFTMSMAVPNIAVSDATVSISGRGDFNGPGTGQLAEYFEFLPIRFRQELFLTE